MTPELTNLQQSAVELLKQHSAGIKISESGEFVESKGSEEDFSARLGALATFMSPAMIKGTHLVTGQAISDTAEPGTFRIAVNHELRASLVPELQQFAATLADKGINFPGAAQYRSAARQ